MDNDHLKAQTVIIETKNWIEKVVIGCQFCPFAAREFVRNSIHYQVSTSKEMAEFLAELIDECRRLDNHPEIETSFLILPEGMNDFYDYLHLVDLSEKLIRKQKYEGIYQVASFHPDYVFADAETDDAANYTNRSLYPMLHLLREESLESALDKFPDPENIPVRNMEYARSKGLEFMKALREACKRKRIDS
jgi:hypothetical protein